MADYEDESQEDMFDTDEAEVVEEEELEYDVMSANLVEELMKSREGSEGLDDLTETVGSMYSTCRDSSSEYRERCAEKWKMFAGDRPEKEFPFEHCANGHLPMMMENILRIEQLMYGELFGDNDNIMGVKPTTPHDKVADLLTHHGNWQLNNTIPDFFRQMERALLLYCLNGDVTIHSYYDQQRAQNRHEALSPDQFMTPQVYAAVQPDYSDLPYYCQTLEYSKNELLGMEDIWYGVEEILEERNTGEAPENPLRDVVEEVEGIDEPEGYVTDTYHLVIVEGWMDLPGQRRQYWCKAIYHPGSESLLQLNVHEEPGWEERQRFERQGLERNDYLMLRTQFNDQAEARAEQVAGIAAEGESGVRVSREDAQLAIQAIEAQPSMPPPVRPEWMDSDDAAPEAMRPDPIHMYTHGVYIEPLAGNLGYGVGDIQYDLNLAGDTMLNQYVDACTLGNTKSIITSDLVEFPGPLDLTPGAINKASGVSGGELKNNIMPLDFGGGNGQLSEMITKFQGVAQSSIQSPGILSGEAGKSGETWRGVNTRSQQAHQQLSVTTKKFALGVLAPVLRNNARLNAIYMDEQEFFMVNMGRGEHEMLMAGREMYQRNYNVTITSDMTYSSQSQNSAKAEQLMNIITQTQFLSQNISFVQQVIIKFLKASGMEDMIPYLGPEAPPPQQPMGLGQAQPPQEPGEERQGANGASGMPPEGPPQPE